VLDPFCGSGVTGIEAIKLGRKAVLIDVNPVATELVRLTLTPVDLNELKEAFNVVKAAAAGSIREMYATRCRSCDEEIDPICTIWEEENPTSVRYKCPHCGEEAAQGYPLTQDDLDRLNVVTEEPITEWFPSDPLLYPKNRAPFIKRERYRSIPDLFTPRNLAALAKLMGAIERTEDALIRDFLKIAFTSMVHNCSRMMPVRASRPFSAGWVQHSYWYCQTHMESHVWAKFEEAFSGRQSLIHGKEESNELFPRMRFAKRFEQLEGRADLLLQAASCVTALREFPSESIDYIFTDPPYAGAIQFGELCFLWAAWLGMGETYFDHVQDEIIENRSQGKDFDIYYSGLHAAFGEAFRLLKPGRHMTVTFHNPTIKIRNATIRAAASAGFEYQKIVYQPPNRPSLKSLYQPFGSATGDFYLRFEKPQKVSLSTIAAPIEEHRFDRIVVDTAVRVIAQRGEPTPYTHIINQVDPELFRHGFFADLPSGRDVADVLREHEGQEFARVKLQQGKSIGEAWWLVDPGIVHRLKTIPLSERLEAVVLRELQANYQVTFTEVLQALYREFPNALTPDTHDLRDFLEEYAQKSSGGYWRLKETEQQAKNESEHARMMHHLATIGHSLGFEVSIGTREKGSQYEDLLLVQLETASCPFPGDAGEETRRAVGDIDIIWHDRRRIQYIFEVENTTRITEAFFRASHIEYPVAKFIVIPFRRRSLLQRRLRSPLFAELFERGEWQIFYYEDILGLLSKRKRLTLDEMLSQASSPHDPRPSASHNKGIAQYRFMDD